jgi:hypothetical protein
MLLEQIDASKDRLVKFIESLNWTEDELEMPFYRLRYMMYGYGNETKGDSFLQGADNANS